MRIEEALDLLCDEAKRNGADKFDAVAGESDSLGVEIFESKVKNTEISSSRGIGIRLFKNNRPGFAFTEKLSPEAIGQTVRDALNHAALTDELELDLPEPGKPADIDLKSYEPELENVSFDMMKELGLSLESAAKGADARIENVPYLGVSRGSRRAIVRNSNGVGYNTRGNSISAYVGVVAVEGDSRKMGVYSNGGRSLKLDVFEPEFMARRAAERAVELLGAQPAESGEYPVIFSNQVSGRIISMFGSPYFAENVQKGQSRLDGKLGEKIAVPEFTLLCEPHLPGAPGSRLFDGEGVLTQPMEVVREGVLKNYLYNLEAARRAGTAATGNGSRGYSGKAGTGFSNLIVPAGDRSLDDLLAAHPRCILVTKLEGGSGCSATSGEISIGMQGFLYENGKRIQPLENMTINSNYFDMLGLIRGFSKDYSDAFSSVRVPDFLVESMHVAA